MGRIFFSYAREDRISVEKYYDLLKSEGFVPWMDSKDLQPGELWEDRVLQELETADFIMIFLSSQSTTKRGFVQKEIRRAIIHWENMLRNDIFLIPARLEQCVVPAELRCFHWLDLFASDSWTLLLAALHEGKQRRENPGKPHLGETRHHTFFQEDATSVPVPSNIIGRDEIIKLVEKAVRFWQSDANLKRVQFVVKSKLISSRSFNSNQEHLEHLLTNLIGNAVKYSSFGQSVVITLHEENHECLVDVSNYGVPILLEDGTDIFRPYSRGERTSSDSRTGLGIGLTIAKEIVKLTQGTLTVTSEPCGKKISETRFTVRLPGFEKAE